MSREDFIESWLFESPRRVQAMGLIDAIVNNINELISVTNKEPTVISANFKKIEYAENDSNSGIIYYWFESSTGEIILAGEFSKKPQCLTVNNIGKKGAGFPYASDLYVAVLNDRKKVLSAYNSINLRSDDLMTNKGFDIWKRLLSNGHKISIYNKNSVAPGQSHQMIRSVTDLEKFFGDNKTHEQYQFILSESTHSEFETRMIFNSWRSRELSGRTGLEKL